MFVARAARADEPAYVELDGAHAHVLDGAPWSGGRRTGEVLEADGLEFLAPTEPSKVVAVGRNYREHIREMGYDVPVEPTIFLKPPTAVLAPGGDVVLPPAALSSQVEHEGELALVIGRPTRNVPVGRALESVFGVTCANDVTARDLQRRDASLTRAKGFDTFCPLGPWIVTGLDLEAGLTVRCRVNDELRQVGNTRDLVFGLAEIVAAVSAFATLLPGDVVLTGSPGGSARLMAGDEVGVEVEGVGTLCHGVTAS